ncbi:MAG: hypothetical protein JWR21_1782 [Herminiimonas sp.]|nr:hypothetical protein [Herminiimonas sp.]
MNSISRSILLSLVCTMLCAGCYFNNASSSSDQSLTDLKPAPELASETEIGGGMASTPVLTQAAGRARLIFAGFQADANGSLRPAIGGRSLAWLRTVALADGSATAHPDDPNPSDPTINPISLLDPAKVLGNAKANSVVKFPEGPVVDGLANIPFPTGKWFKALFYANDGGTDGKRSGAISPSPENARMVFPLPYGLKVSDADNRIDITFPSKRFLFTGAAEQNVSNPYDVDYVRYHIGQSPETSLRMSYQKTGINAPPVLTRRIDRFDELTTITSWIDKTGASASEMQLIVAVGSPFMTVKYKNMRPQIMVTNTDNPTVPQQVLITAVADSVDPAAISGTALQRFSAYNDGPTVANTPSLTGKAFRIVLTRDDQGYLPASLVHKEMLLFFSSTVRLDWDPATFTYVASDVAAGIFSGTVRAAYVDTVAAQGENNLARDNATTVSFAAREKLLALHSNTFPVAAEVLLRKDNPADDKAAVSYRWTTQLMSAAGNNELLMLALEKTQLPALVASQPRPVLTHPSAFGPMQAVVGTLWQQQLTLPAIMRGGADSDANTIWFGKGRIRPEDKAAIKKVLIEDLATGQEFLPHCAYDSYVCGGFLFRFARMALIADELGEPDLRKQALEFSKHLIEPWFNTKDGIKRLDGTDPNALTFDYFLYDTTNRGTVTNRGLKNVGEDYFNASYIDHMFHYGYYIYAAAVIARYDEAWLTTNLEKVNTLVRDIANASLQDKSYPVMRMYDWYLMRNAADSGPDANGPNTESSSEAINADYAITLWGVVTKNPALQAVGAIMTAGEIRSARAWYQITESNSVFPGVELGVNAVLNPDGRTSSRTLAPAKEIAMGILRTNKPEINTFFSALEHKVVGIQILPLSPISDAVLSRDWAKAHGARLLKMIDTMTDQLGNITGDGPDAGGPKYQPGNPLALCANDINPDKNRDTTKDVGAAKCAGRARMLYNWRGVIMSAHGLNNPADAYQRYLAYRNKVPAQTASFQARTVGAFNGNFSGGIPQTYVDGIGNLDLLKSDTVPGSDVNVLWWLSSNK